MRVKLLTVSDAFEIEGRGVIVAPGPLVQDYQGPPEIDVELVRPDGTRLEARLILAIPFADPLPAERRYGAIFPNLEKDAVPAGTEIFWDAPGTRP